MFQIQVSRSQKADVLERVVIVLSANSSQSSKNTVTVSNILASYCQDTQIYKVGFVVLERKLKWYYKLLSQLFPPYTQGLHLSWIQFPKCNISGVNSYIAFMMLLLYFFRCFFFLLFGGRAAGFMCLMNLSSSVNSSPLLSSWSSTIYNIVARHEHEICVPC